MSGAEGGRRAALLSPEIKSGLPASPAAMRQARSRNSMILPALARGRSAPDILVLDGSHEREGPPKEGIFSRKWTTENKRLLHQHRERSWLRQKGKHGYIDFSDAERAELQRYFDALAVNNRISLDRLENMLISLGLASTRKEVRQIVLKIDANGNGALDFEEYLEIFRTRNDSEMFQVFKAMMEGRLGDRNLNFQTVISTYRRRLFVEATGAKTMGPVRLPSDSAASMDPGTKILNSFANLQKTRYKEAEDEARSVGSAMDKDLLPFDPTGSVPPGGLGMVWRGISDQYNLLPQQQSSTANRSLGVPPSPRTVINDIVKVSKTKKKTGNYGSTIVIPAPALEEGTKLGSKDEADLQ